MKVFFPTPDLCVCVCRALRCFSDLEATHACLSRMNGLFLFMTTYMIGFIYFASDVCSFLTSYTMQYLHIIIRLHRPEDPLGPLLLRMVAAWRSRGGRLSPCCGVAITSPCARANCAAWWRQDRRRCLVGTPSGAVRPGVPQRSGFRAN